MLVAYILSSGNVTIQAIGDGQGSNLTGAGG